MRDVMDFDKEQAARIDRILGRIKKERKVVYLANIREGVVTYDLVEL